MEERKLTQHWINAIQNILECAFENLLGLTLYVKNHPGVLKPETIEGTVELFARGSVVESCIHFIKGANILVEQSFTESERAQVLRRNPEVVFISSEEERIRLEKVGKDLVIRYINGKGTPNNIVSNMLDKTHLWLQSQKELSNSNKEVEAQLKINKVLENTNLDLEDELEYLKEELKTLKKDCSSAGAALQVVKVLSQSKIESLELKLEQSEKENKKKEGLIAAFKTELFKVVSKLKSFEQIIAEYRKDIILKDKLIAEKDEAIKRNSDARTNFFRNSLTQKETAEVLGVSPSTVSRQFKNSNPFKKKLIVKTEDSNYKVSPYKVDTY